MNTRFLSIAFLVIFLLVSATDANAATRTWDGGGVTNNFSEAANWSGDVAPMSADDIIFNATSQKNAAIDQTVSVRIFRMSGYNGTITQAGAVNVSVVTFELTTGTYIGSDGSFTIIPGAGSSAINGSGTFAGGTGLFTFDGGDASAIFNVGGSFTLGGDAVIRNLRISAGGTLNASSGILEVRGSQNALNYLGGTFNANGGTVKTAGTITGNSSLAFFNLQVGAPTSLSGTNIGVNGTLTLESGKSLNGGSLNINGDVVFQTGFNGSTQLIYGGTATMNKTITGANINLPILINNPNLTLTTGGAAGETVTFSRKVTIQNGTFQQGAENYLFNASANFNDPGFLVSGGTFQGGSAPVIFNTTIGISSGNLNAGTGDLGTNGVCPSFPTANYFFQQSGGSFNGGAGNARFCDLRRTGGSFTAPSGNLTISTRGDFTGGTFNANNGTLIVENNVTIIAPGFTLNNVTLSGANAHSIAGTPKPIINGAFNLAEGQFSSGDVAANGDVVYGTNFTGGGGRLFFEGTATRTINLPARNILLGMTLDNPNITVTTSGAGASSFTGEIDVKRGILQQGNAVLNVAPQILRVSGGTFTGSSAALNIVSLVVSGGIFSGGSGSISGGFGTGITQSGGTFSTVGDVEITFLTLSGGKFNAPNGLMTVVADWTHTAGGTFNAGTGTVKFTGYNTFNCANTILVSVTTTETFNNLEIANTFCNRRLVFPSATLIVNGDLRLTAAGIDGGKIRPLGTTTIDAGNNSYVSSTILEYITPNRAFVINNPAGTTRTLPIEMNAANSTLTSSGTGRLNVYALDLINGTVNQGAGVWDLTNAGLIQNFGFYKQSGGTFNGSSFELFVNPQLSGGEFNSGTGKLTGNSLITGGTMTLNGDMDSTQLTLQGGTFNAPLGTLRLGEGGNCGFSHTTAGGTFNPRTGTVIANPCSFDVNARETFNNLIFRGSSSIATNDTLVANGTTTFNGGFVNGGSIEANGDVQHINGGSGNSNGNPNNGTTVLKFVDTATRTINFNTSNANYTVINTLVNNPNITINLGTTENVSASFNNGLTLQQGTINQGAGQVPILIYNQSGGTYNGGTYSVATNLNAIGNFTLSGGTFNAAPTTTFNGNFTHTAGGEFNEGTGTVFFVSTFNGANGIVDVNGTETFNNVNFRSGNGTNIAAGDTLIINGLTTLQSGTVNGGTLDVKRNVDAPTVNLGGSFRGGDANVIFSGLTDQIFTNPSGFPTFGGTWTINKPNSNGFADKSENNSAIAAPSTLFLNGNVGNSNTGGSLPLSFPNMNLVSGYVEQGNGANLSLGSFSSALGTSFTNLGDGDLILAGNLTNNGFMNINGSGSGCPQPDAVLFRSSVTGTQRNWNGSGTFRITDVDVRDQAGNALITANSSTNTANNGTNWTFTENCLTTASTVAVGGKVTNAKGRGIANVRLTLTSSDGAIRQTVTNAFGVYRFVEVRAGETYLIEARAKRFQFSDSTQSVSVNEDLSNVNFTALQ